MRSDDADGAEEGDWTESAASLSRARRRRDLGFCIVMAAMMRDYNWEGNLKRMQQCYTEVSGV